MREVTIHSGLRRLVERMQSLLSTWLDSLCERSWGGGLDIARLLMDLIPLSKKVVGSDKRPRRQLAQSTGTLGRALSASHREILH